MLVCLSMLNEKTKKKEQFFNFVKKGFLLSKPAGALMTDKGASGQEKMVLGQAKGNNKPKETCSCYLHGKKGHMAGNCGRNTVG